VLRGGGGGGAGGDGGGGGGGAALEGSLAAAPPSPPVPRFRRFLRILGPGLVTGAADDDPSGIATYTQTGAQFGYGQLWTAVFMLPLQTAVQEACARIGAVTGTGLAGVVKARYSRPVLYAVVLLVLVANTINIGADLGAMAAAAALVVPLSPALLTIAFAAAILLLEIFTSYHVYARVLKWLALALIAYPLTALIVHLPAREVLRATFVPHIEFGFGFFFLITGVLGTTISPYMFFWQASQEVEEEREQGRIRPREQPRLDRAFIRALRIDTLVGMVASESATWSIIVVGAAVLHTNGVTDVATAADAARALEPLVLTFPNAGYLAKLVFAAGIIGLGLLAVPVLSGSAAYAICEALNWREGLNLNLKRAHGFYGVITVATLLGLGLNFVGINPVRALVVTAVINGVVAVPLLFLIARIASDEAIMGEYKSGVLSNLLVWVAFVAMGAAALALFATLGRG
jgi:NRAMP (natural resistance-associated macrophage protein)-like metal ion transporter